MVDKCAKKALLCASRSLRGKPKNPSIDGGLISPKDQTDGNSGNNNNGTEEQDSNNISIYYNFYYNYDFIPDWRSDTKSEIEKTVGCLAEK